MDLRLANSPSLGKNERSDDGGAGGSLASAVNLALLGAAKAEYVDARRDATDCHHAVRHQQPGWTSSGLDERGASILCRYGPLDTLFLSLSLPSLPLWHCVPCQESRRRQQRWKIRLSAALSVHTNFMRMEAGNNKEAPHVCPMKNRVIKF